MLTSDSKTTEPFLAAKWYESTPVASFNFSSVASFYKSNTT